MDSGMLWFAIIVAGLIAIVVGFLDMDNLTIGLQGLRRGAEILKTK